MTNIFNMDNKFFTMMDTVGDLVMLNIAFIICSLPIVTIGASCTALYKVTLDIVKKEEGAVVLNFLSAFKTNFKKSTIVWSVLCIIIAILFVDFIIVESIKTSLGSIMTIGLYIIVFILIMGVSYLFPILAVFENNIKNSVKNSFLMAIGDFPLTLTIVFMNCLGAMLFFSGGKALAYVILAYLLIGFSGVAFINSTVLERVFKKYLI